MALAFGGGVRPELGRTDYSAIARGSEMAAQMAGRGAESMAQGLAGALAGASAALRNYQDKKEQKEFKKQTTSRLSQWAMDNPDMLAQAGINIDPKDTGALEAYIKGLSPKGDFREGAFAANQLIQGLESQKAQSSALARALQSRGPSQAEQAIRGGATFEQLGGMSFEPTQQSLGEFGSKLAAAGVDPKNIPSYLQAQLAERQMLENARQQEFNRQRVATPEVIPRTPDEAYRAAGLTPKNAKVIWQKDYGYVAIPNTPTEQKKLDKIEEEEKKAIATGNAEKLAKIEAGKAAREDINSTIALIQQSIELAKAGAGGPIAGTYPVRTLGAMATAVPGIGMIARAAGSDYAVRQKANYDTIRARLTFDKIKDLKSLTGSTGLGNTSNLEFTALGDSAGRLDPTLPEDQQIEILENIKVILAKLAERRDPDERGGGPVVISRRPIAPAQDIYDERGN